MSAGPAGRACRDRACRDRGGRACRDRPRADPVLGTLLAVATTGWLVAEAVHAAADRSGRPRPPDEQPRPSQPETLLVLGSPSRPGGRPSARQRWRVHLAARNAGPTTRLVFSGAGEAAVMAALATRDHGIAGDRIRCENRALTTWDNVGLAAPLVPAGGVVRMISDPLHARRADRYWRRRLPDRADELRPARLYGFGERPLLKVATAVYEVLLRSLRYRPGEHRIWRPARQPG